MLSKEVSKCWFLALLFGPRFLAPAFFSGDGSLREMEAVQGKWCERPPGHRPTFSPCSQKGFLACWGLTLGRAGTGPGKLQGWPWHKEMFQSGNIIYTKIIWICWTTEYSQLWGALPSKNGILQDASFCSENHICYCYIVTKEKGKEI